VRHICGYEDDDLAVLERGILSDYRWLLSIARRQSLSFAASQCKAVADCVRDRRENHVGSYGGDDAVDLRLDFERDLKNLADILKFCVPSTA
jgi:hypothetical protein